MPELLEPPVTPTNDCAHHWVLMAPSGKSTAGTCKLCGESKEFQDAYHAPSRSTPQPAKKPAGT